MNEEGKEIGRGMEQPANSDIATGDGSPPIFRLAGVTKRFGGVVGFFFMPNTTGRSMEEIEAERSRYPAPDRVPA